MAVKVPVKGDLEYALGIFRKKSSATRREVKAHETFESKGKKRKRQAKEAARKSKQNNNKY